MIVEYNQILKILYLSIIITFSLSQKLIIDQNEFDRLRSEYHSLLENKVKEENFITPFVEKKPSISYYNILNQFDYKKYLILEPVLSIRNSSNGFEFYNNHDLSLKPVLWISPGIKLHSTIPLIYKGKNIWIYNWASYYKHSAYGFSSNKTFIDYENPLSNYNKEYAFEYYEPTKSPDNGIDFGYGDGGISILSNDMQFIFGKFNTNLGPSINSNLSISNNAPSFDQLLFKINFNKKLYFTYLIGSLTSYIPKYINYTISEEESVQIINDEILYENQWVVHNDYPDEFVNEYDNYLSQFGVPMHERYVVNHRFDFIPKKNFRLGLYEQLIFGGRNIPFSYLIPLNPLIANQQSSNDQDNLQWGIDWEYIFNNKRVYGGLLMDEWALYDTFNSSERNWFAVQFGGSFLIRGLDRDAFINIEYTRVDPGAYNHRFKINEPKHHGYNIGYWSGNNSDDLIIKLVLFISDITTLKFEYQSTRFGTMDDMYILQQQYDNVNGVSFLEGGYLKKESFKMSYSKLIYKNIYFDFDVLRQNSIIDESDAGFYPNHLTITDKYYDFRINLRYNISK